MADPFSFVAGAVGIADVTIRVITYLRDVKAAIETIDADIDGLISEVISLKQVHEHLDEEYHKQTSKGGLSAEETMLWEQTKQTLKNGQTLVTKLEISLRQVFGDVRTVTRKRDGFTKQNRKRDKDGMIAGFRDQIHTYHSALHIWLAFIAMHSAREDRDSQQSQFDRINTSLHDLKRQVEHSNDASLPPYDAISTTAVYNDFTSISLSVLSQIGTSVKSVGETLALDDSVVNEHFDTPKPVDQFYTGRKDKAEQLRRWLLPNSLPRSGEASIRSQEKQSRFVVYGVAGSGKTQFACKFAEENREMYWGVFWVDGSSSERFRQTFSQNVSTIGKVESNEKAALNWLSNCTKPWLLIIDNADDPTLDLNDYFPRGKRGHILITTRDPLHKSYGTVGDEFFEFQGLKTDEASCLLLTAAGESKPWTSTMSKAAAAITKLFGYLALAITHAGKTIRQGFCTLHDYLEYHKREWERMRVRRQAVKSSHVADDLDVLTTFELNRRAIEDRANEASKDALQLLDTFAFLHNQDIRFDILKRAITNARVENAYQLGQLREEVQARASRPPVPWSVWYRDTLFTILTSIYKNRSPPVLPDIIRTGRELEDFDPYRLRAALRQLTQSSLITHNNKSDSYSMHPLVHKWARERPDISIAEQAVWSEAAAVLLSHSILLPPLGNITEDEELRKYLLPHVAHVRECQQSIEQRIRDKRMARMKPWPVFEGGFNKEKALMYAKYSIVYAQHGKWEEARRLQLAVRDFTMQVRGMQHAATRRITLALSATLFHLGQSDDAAALQEEVVDACISHLGADHHETLIAKGTLGESRFLQGRVSDAKALQQEAVTGLTKLYGINNLDTLNAIDGLGRTVLKLYSEEDVRDSQRLLRQAVEGMSTLLGKSHLRTLIARENLCQVAIQTEDEVLLKEAHETMLEILETRKEKLSKEHAYTLLAILNLALVKSGQGDFEDADRLIHQALPIAERNLGPDHVACLWARYHIGKIWVKQKRWEEAELHLIDCTERQRNLLQGRGQYHPDRLGALIELATVYHARGKMDECNRVVDEALIGFEKVTKTYQHPIAKKLKDDRQRWNDERNRIIGI